MSLVGWMPFVVASVIAQVQTPAPPPVTGRTLLPDDVLRIQVLRQPELTIEAPVGQDGTVSAVGIGQVVAQGKTPAQLSTELEALYKERVRLKQPQVSVSIIRFRDLRASIGGFVNRPNSYVYRSGDTVKQLLDLGGGPIPDRADLRRATLQRAKSNELIPIDLYSMLYRGDISQNYELQDGDQLNIPEATRLVVLVQGKIARPGIYPYKEPMTVADAISSAGGEVPGRSRLSRTLVVRERAGQPGQYQYINVDYVRFIRKRDQTQNILLQPGDLLFIPETNTPDFAQISALTNTVFIFNSLGSGLFGFNLFR